MLFDTVRLSRIPKPYVDTFIKPEMLVSSNPLCYNAIARCNKLCKLYSKGLTDTTEYFELLSPPRTFNNPGNILMLGGKDSESSWGVYNSQLNRWYKQRTTEVGRSNGNVFKLQSNLCCFIGGEDVFRKIVNTCATYDSLKKCWAEGIPTPGLIMCGTGCVEWKDDVYLLGGMAPDEGYTSSVERYTVTKKRWVPVKSMKEKRFSFGCDEVDGFLYAFGGFNGYKDLKDCKFFMPAANEWTDASSMHVPRSGGGGAAVDGKIFAVGSWSGTAIERSCESYDPRNNKWNKIASMSIPRHGCQLVPV